MRRAVYKERRARNKRILTLYRVIRYAKVELQELEREIVAPEQCFGSWIDSDKPPIKV